MAYLTKAQYDKDAEDAVEYWKNGEEEDGDNYEMSFTIEEDDLTFDINNELEYARDYVEVGDKSAVALREAYDFDNAVKISEEFSDKLYVGYIYKKGNGDKWHEGSPVDGPFDIQETLYANETTYTVDDIEGLSLEEFIEDNAYDYDNIDEQERIDLEVLYDEIKSIKIRDDYFDEFVLVNNNSGFQKLEKINKYAACYDDNNGVHYQLAIIEK